MLDPGGWTEQATRVHAGVDGVCGEFGEQGGQHCARVPQGDQSSGVQYGPAHFHCQHRPRGSGQFSWLTVIILL